jgi:hypothetical protein
MQTSPPIAVPNTIETRPHALPYTVIFEEQRSRRGDSSFLALLQQWSKAPANPGLPSPEIAWATFENALIEVDTAYLNLTRAHGRLRDASRRTYGTPELRKAAIEAAHVDVDKAALACQAADAPMKSLLHLCSSSALCFSGGGIRSASFSLGILQALARFSVSGSPATGFLYQLHYLSTVSGGGYIGSWLMGWARRSNFSTAVNELGRPGKTAGDPEPDPVRHLRDYTSFLAPRYGFSVDTATLGAIVLRNLFLNWIIFLPCLIVLILLPQLLTMAGNSLAAWVVSLPGSADQTLMWVAAVFIAIAGWIAGYRAWKPPSVFAQSSSVFRNETAFFWVTLLASWFIVEAWIAGWINDPPLYSHFSGTRVFWLVVDFTIASIPMSIARFGRVMPFGTDPFHVARRLLWGRALWSFCAGPLAGAVVALALELFAVHIGPALAGDNANNLPDHRFDVVALPVVLMLLMIGSAVLSGMLSTVEEEEEREWWARAGGVFLIILMIWIGAEVVSWYSGIFVADPKYRALLWGSCSALFGGSAAAAGNSAASTAGIKRVDLSQLSGAGRFLARNQLLPPLLSFAALICILLLVGSLNELLLSSISTLHPVTALYDLYSRAQGNGEIHFFNSASDLAVPLVIVAALLVALFANYCINVNTFSLHGMYRMRLVRAFLGASNFGRDADRFTNFDKSDNIPQSDLQSTADAPIHVVNTALNLVNVQKKAWQQRKAESFTFTPFQCGSWRLGYAPTEIYGGIHGVTLGTAMAISGAAFNPNMGYNSSPLVTLLMTLFNARLGWWLPNPAWHLRKHVALDSTDGYLSKNGPTFALASILSEALGKTDDRRKWIQLSDGGHFENLGLYEMVLRRCRHIVLVDAGADREFQFEDLGNAIRKINIDLGIPITFPGLVAWPLSNQKAATDRYCVVGKIDYCCVDPAAPTGYLIYIKPQLIGREPRDVTAYAAAHSAFPHETTANQFFNEAQFESYRHLGSHAFDEILGNPRANAIADLLAAAFTHSGQTPF